MFHPRRSLFFFLIILTLLISVGCEDEIISPDISEDEIIGTWVLTKVIVSYPIGQRELTPEGKKVAMSLILRSDKTYQRHQDNQGEITDDTGTWMIERAVLSLTSDSKTYDFPCRLNGNVLLAIATVIDPDSGIMVPIKLEFTKLSD